MIPSCRLLSAVFLVTVLFMKSSATTFTLKHAFLNGTGSGLGSEWLGSSIAMSGNLAVAGAWISSTHGGEVALYKRGADGNWTEDGYLHAFDSYGSANNHYGRQVLINEDGDTIAVLAEGIGAVYVYNRYSSVQKITLAGVNRMAIDGSTLAIAATGESSSAGAVYIYTKNVDTSVWSLEQKLTAFDASANDYFGVEMAIDGNTIAVGAHGDDNWRGTDAGAVYMYERVGTVWSATHKLIPGDLSNSNHFGKGLALRNNILLAAAAYQDSNQGAVYVYYRNAFNWVQQTKLTSTIQRFAEAIAMDKTVTTVAFGSYDTNAGAVAIYQRNGTVWTETQQIFEPYPGNSESAAWFGLGLAMSCGDLFVGVSTYTRMYVYTSGVCTC